MKKIKIFLSAILLASSLYSCDDATNIIQLGELEPDKAYQTVNDLKIGLSGVYGAIAPESEISFNSIFTDEISIGKNNGGQGLTDGSYAFVLNSGSDAPASLWSSNYAVINFANRLIKGATLVTVQPGEEAQYNDILAQAYAIRAYAHLKLVSYFSTDMSDDNALGVIILDHVPTIYENIPRSTNGEVYDFIESDLAFAETNLAPSIDRTHVTVNFINALRARMALYRENYTEAVAYADLVISEIPLTPRASYTSIFTDLVTGNDETIFRLERTGTTDTRVGQIWATNNATITGGVFFEIGRSLYNLLETGDIRRSVIVAASSTPSTNPADDVLVVGKYTGSEGIALLNDIKIVRTSEMYFIKAEALTNSGDLAGAADAIKAVRDKRFTAPQPVTYANAQAAWNGILTERRIELAFEGHRYLDLRRIGAKAGQTILRDANDCAVNGSCTLPITDYRFTLPIPVLELNANTAITGQQNPGY